MTLVYSIEQFKSGKWMEIDFSYDHDVALGMLWDYHKTGIPIEHLRINESTLEEED